MEERRCCVLKKAIKSNCLKEGGLNAGQKTKTSIARCSLSDHLRVRGDYQVNARKKSTLCACLAQVDATIEGGLTAKASWRWTPQAISDY